ncbi:hypothetical protein F3J24_01915 [Comamonas sp. Tr-654]|uniref:hypothetical protein n=1 Tax=Comamonas sp. Tr-654 TaxID=2608341 RepID=UPI001422ACBF|nr:hypothetical protein [Comamonas sp. Tr-654]NIF82268.1 hypothetical protein [Comamonas sp. Tr-654]
MAHALNYPTIEFQDTESLKKSLLLWDRVFRIVPSGYNPDDCSEVKTAVSSGSVVDLEIDKNDKWNAANGFLNFFERRHDYRNILPWPAGLSTATFTRINPEKIDAKLLPLFEQLSQRMSSDGFLEVPSEHAGAYMFYLASYVAKQRSMDLITDSSDYWAVGTYFSQNGNFGENVWSEKSNAFLANLAIDDLLPMDLSQVSIDTILRFNEDNIEQRKNFQKEVFLLREEVSRCNNKEHAKYIVADFIKTFEKAKDEYKKSIGFFRKNEIFSIFSVGLPVTATILSMPIGGADPYAPFRLCAGVLIGAVSAFATNGLIKKEKTVASYLVDSENMTRKPNWLLHRKFNEFIND